MSDNRTTLPTLETASDYSAILSTLRDADRIATRAAARIARVYDDHARNETLALCDRIIAGCEVRRMVREARLGISEYIAFESLDCK